MTALLKGWSITTIGQIAEIGPRHPQNLEDSLTVTFVRMPALSETDWNFKSSEERPLGQVRKGFTHFAEGDILFAKITPCMENGKAAIASQLSNGLGCGTTELHVLRPLGEINPKYIYHFIHRDSFREEAARNFTGSAGQLRVPVSFVCEAEVPLPPFKEQHRIVAKLEKLLSRVNAAQSRLTTIPRTLKRFRQSVLAAACSGRLTADWRGNLRQSREPRWQVMPAQDACEVVQSGSTPAKDRFRSDVGIPYLKIYNIVNQRIDFLHKKQYIDLETQKNLKRSIVKPGDVLMNIVGPPLGKVALVPSTHPEWNINQALVLFRPKAFLSSQFLYYLLCSGLPYSEILNETRGSAGQSNISLSQCREMLLSLPEFEEQQEIVRRVQALFKTADALEARYIKAKAHVDKLTQSILAKAFRGELVAQDPNDQPASVLLERIRKVRAADVNKKVRRTK